MPWRQVGPRKARCRTRSTRRSRTRSSAPRASCRGPSLESCAECGAKIPEARREAIPGVRLCLTCQEAKDREGDAQRRLQPPRQQGQSAAVVSRISRLQTKRGRSQRASPLLAQMRRPVARDVSPLITGQGLVGDGAELDLRERRGRACLRTRALSASLTLLTSAPALLKHLSGMPTVCHLPAGTRASVSANGSVPPQPAPQLMPILTSFGASAIAAQAHQQHHVAIGFARQVDGAFAGDLHRRRCRRPRTRSGARLPAPGRRPRSP